MLNRASRVHTSDAGTKRFLSICYVSADYPIPGTVSIGGIGAHTYALAHAIVALGHQVTVLTQSDDAPSHYRDGPIDVHALPPPSLRMWKLGNVLPLPWLRRSLAVWRALRRLHAQRPFDLVSFPDGYGEGFVHSFAPVAPAAVQLFGPASIVQRWDGRAVPKLRARVEALVERRPARQASMVICATHRFAKAMSLEWTLAPERLRIVRNPLDLARFHPGTKARDTLTVLFAGHLQRLKGLGTLADAIPTVVRQYPDVEFLLVGNDTRSAPGGTSMREHLQHVLAAHGVTHHVRFIDPMPQVDLVALYQQCALFVLPSLNDVYPNAVLEAMACGRPCVVTHNVGVAELISECDGGEVVATAEPAALAVAICRLLQMPAGERDRMGARARRAVERACAPKTIAQQTIEAYRWALRDARPSGATR